MKNTEEVKKLPKNRGSQKSQNFEIFRKRKNLQGFLGNRKGISKLTLLIFLVCFGILLFTFLGAYWGMKKPDLSGMLHRIWVPPFGGKEKATILVMGTDKDGKHGRTDTMILFILNVKTKHLGALSIPRDSMVELPDHGIEKINSAYALGGVWLAQTAVEDLVGISPDYYVVIHLEGFKEIIDTLGGVEIEVEKRMYYRDRHQNLYIDLKPGKQILNGEQALGYVRFRHDAQGDIGRIQRQQKFLNALVRKQTEPMNIVKLPALLPQIFKNVETNLALRDLMGLAEIFKKVKVSEIYTAMVPGEAVRIHRVSYWQVDPDKMMEVWEKLNNSVDRPDEEVAIVDVLNGSGISGQAKAVAEKLEAEGFEINRVGNADRADYFSTQIVVYNNRKSKAAERISEVMGCGEVVERQGQNHQADIAIVIGKDYQAY